jgi:hypothetical protein
MVIELPSKPVGLAFCPPTGWHRPIQRYRSAAIRHRCWDWNLLFRPRRQHRLPVRDSGFGHSSSEPVISSVRRRPLSLRRWGIVLLRHNGPSPLSPSAKPAPAPLPAAPTASTPALLSDISPLFVLIFLHRATNDSHHASGSWSDSALAIGAFIPKSILTRRKSSERQHIFFLRWDTPRIYMRNRPKLATVVNRRQLDNAQLSYRKRTRGTERFIPARCSEFTARGMERICPRRCGE